MLREEELNLSTDQFLTESNQDGQEKDFSFIQNRVPSPLNNNFLLSAEQSRHVRQPSEGFLTSAHNLMTQEEFKLGWNGFGVMNEQDKIEEQQNEQDDAEDDDDDDLETSKLTLFTNDCDNILQLNRDHENHNNLITQQQQIMTTESESNGIFNYSESAYPAGSSSLGAIINNMNNNNNIGSFIYNQSRGSQPYNSNGGGGRDSTATPFYYDENSLMNLSNSPTSILINRNSSNLNKAERLISSTKLNHKYTTNNHMVQILEDQEDEQDESMLPNSNFNNSRSRHHHSFNKEQQDIWVVPSKKYDPLELPLQRNLLLINNSSPFEQVVVKQQQENNNQQSRNETMFSRGGGNWNILIDNNNNENNNNNNGQLNQEDGEEANEDGDDIQMIKKKLDFSRLSSLQNLSYATYQQQQIMLSQQQQQPCSFMFQTQQSLTSNSLGNDTHHYSTYQLADQDRFTAAIPFEELLTDHLMNKTIGQQQATLVGGEGNFKMFKTFTKDEGIQTITNEINNDKTSEEEDCCGGARGNKPYQNILNYSSPSKTIHSARPPALNMGVKPFQQAQPYKQQAVNTCNNYPIQQVEFVQQNCINIFSTVTSADQQQFPQNLIQTLQVPPASRTNSTNSYTAQSDMPVYGHNVQTSFLKQQSQKGGINNKKGVNFNPKSDTPRDPSSIMIDQQSQDFNSIVSRQVNPKLGFLKKQSTLDSHDFMHTIAGSLVNEATEDGQERNVKNSGINKPKKLRIKKKQSIADVGCIALKQATSKTRIGSSKPRSNLDMPKAAVAVHHNMQSQKAVNAQQMMSKTMIIQKEKIQPPSNQQSSETIHYISDGSFKHNTIQIAQKLVKQKQQANQHMQSQQTHKQIQNAKEHTQYSFIQPQSSSPVITNSASVSGAKSIPNSNQSSTQNSFLTFQNTSNPKINTKTNKAVTIKGGPVLKKKIQQNNKTHEVKEIKDEKQKKAKKKNASITRQQLLGTTQQVAIKPQQQVCLKDQQVAQTNQSKCNTQRSVSRSKRCLSQYNEPPKIQILGQKKNSHQVLLITERDSHQNKENIRPQIYQKPSSAVSTKQQTHHQHNKGITSSTAVPFNQHQNQANIKMIPEQLMQTFDSLKLLNAQDLLKEFHQSQQQRLSLKNITTQQNLFNNGLDITKRVKTEQNNGNIHIRSMQTFDNGSNNNNGIGNGDFDPYNMLMTLDTQRIIENKQKSMLQQSTEIFSDYSKKGQAQANGIKQKMQSPYNSKTMKNKFTSNKNKKPLEYNHGLSAFGSTTQLLSTSVTNLESIFNNNNNNQTIDDDNCKRCHELIQLIKTNRDMGR